jgi:hypothetical protein
MDQKYSRTQFLRIALGSAAAVYLSSPSAGAYIDIPLGIPADAGVFLLVPLAAEKRGRGGRRRTLRKGIETFSAVWTRLLERAAADAFTRVHKPRAVSKSLGSLLKQALSQVGGGVFVGKDGASIEGGTAGDAAGLGIGAVVTTQMTLDETLSLDFTISGSSHHLDLDQVVTKTISGSQIQANHSALPTEDQASPYLFALLARETSAPGTGVLLLLLVDPLLRNTLGVADTDYDGAETTFDYDATITGSVSGPHDANTPTFEDRVYGKSGILQIGVPPELAEQAEALLKGL